MRTQSRCRSAVCWVVVVEEAVEDDGENKLHKSQRARGRCGDRGVEKQLQTKVRCVEAYEGVDAGGNVSSSHGRCVFQVCQG